MKLDIKKQTSNTIILRLTIRDAAPESLQVRPESLETFEPSYTSSKVKNENDANQNAFPTLRSNTSQPEIKKQI